ncbi:hypothetical protein VNO78_05505 [Psophocarpus tetragonolobus]|uniref:Uncharacterized protein n=1 Tax=Psophocarpus tetragonolobus TaxID=3891 RepID=A0AAN9SZN0_PSOTE
MRMRRECNGGIVVIAYIDMWSRQLLKKQPHIKQRKGTLYAIKGSAKEKYQSYWWQLKSARTCLIHEAKKIAIYLLLMHNRFPEGNQTCFYSC